jgi:3',5'-cyclic AMP phosphodiesterase CpdA
VVRGAGWHACRTAARHRDIHPPSNRTDAVLTLLHISDLHFGPMYHADVGERVQEFAHELRPDVIVASGDFTQRARRRQFRDARAYLDRLPDVPRIVTPGNHDVPLYRVSERLFSPFRKYRRFISAELDLVTTVPGAVFVSLNSTSPRRHIVNGRLSRRQLAFAEEAFRAAEPNAYRIVVTHHHFAPPPDFEGGDAMPEAKRALDLFAACDVDLILGGHMHRAYIGNSLDLYAGQDRSHGIVIAQSGTTTSRRGRAREREKNTFNVVRLSRDTIRITHYLYFDDVGRFLPTSRHVFYRGGRPPLNRPRAVRRAEPQPSTHAVR